jgi:single-stranded-DNA-specific exonuclease
MCDRDGTPELQIHNAVGDTLQVKKGQRIATLSKSGQQPQAIDVSEAPFYDLVKTAVAALSASRS